VSLSNQSTKAHPTAADTSSIKDFRLVSCRKYCNWILYDIFRLIWTNSSECRTFWHESLRRQSLPPNSDEMRTDWLPIRQRVIYKLSTLTCTPYRTAVLFSRTNTRTGHLDVCGLLKIIAFLLFLPVLFCLLSFSPRVPSQSAVLLRQIVRPSVCP